MIETFGSNFLYGVSDAARFAADVIESGFAGCALESVVKVDLITPIETVLSHVQDHAKRFVDAMKALYEVFKTEVFRVITTAITTLGDVFEEVTKFFEPFDPVDAILNTRVNLPWFNPPYTEKKLG